MSNEEHIRIAILEQKIEDLKPIVYKIDHAIEKLSEVNTTVSRMLAVHEERISKQEEIDTVLFAKVDKLSDKIDRNNDSLFARIRKLEQKVWKIIGGFAAATIILNVTGMLVRTGILNNLLAPAPQPVIIQGR